MENIWRKKTLENNRHLFETWIFIKEISMFDTHTYIYIALYVIEIALRILGIQ